MNSIEIVKKVVGLKKDIINRGDIKIEKVYTTKNKVFYKSINNFFKDVVEFESMRYKNIFYKGNEAKLILINENEDEKERCIEVYLFEKNKEC